MSTGGSGEGTTAAAVAPAVRVVVMKFGGSCLATDALRACAADRVAEARDAGRQVIVVTSAIGRKPAPYSTDSLLALVPHAMSGPNIDLLLASGEMISAAIFAECLASRHIAARALTGAQAGVLTDDRHGDARVLAVDTSALAALLVSGIVPVVCGFQGVTHDGAFTTLGRGGSDLSAVALCSAFKESSLDIYTDVEGVMTADPKRVPSARTIPVLDFEEVNELAQHGASVVHDRAAALARESRLPFAVRSLRSGIGTAISDDAQRDARHPVTGVAASFGFTFFHVAPDAANLPGGWEQDAFRSLWEAGVSLDCVNLNAAGLFFIVRDADRQTARDRLASLPVALRMRHECAKIAIVGAGMRGTPGVMYRVVSALNDASVPIIHSTDSNVTISVLVPGPLAARAENTLHDQFELGAQPQPGKALL